MDILIISILLIAAIYIVSRHERDIQHRKKKGWSRYDANNSYEPENN